MSLLPQRKKSAEEISQLRETLGVPALQGNQESATTVVIDSITSEVTEPASSSPRPAPPQKTVRSFRKSEQVPILLTTPPNPDPDSKLPFQRRSDEEIAAIRRRETLAMMSPPPRNWKLAVAHPVILVFGYLCALAGALCFFFAQFPILATAVCGLVALLIAAIILWRYPICRHHAAFIAVIALLVLAFALLHYFPHLRNAT
jgi:hypothetical protein